MATPDLEERGLVFKGGRMTVVVEEDVKIGDTVFPGYISTFDQDVPFLREVMSKWAGYTDNEIDIVIGDAEGSLHSANLQVEGFWVSDKDTSINLIKVGEGQWVASGLDYAGLEKLASCLGV